MAVTPAVANLATVMRPRIQTTRDQLVSSLTRLWDQYARVTDIGTFANLAAELSLAAQSVVWDLTQLSLRLYCDEQSGVGIEDLVTVPMPAQGCREMDVYREYRWPLVRALKLLQETGDEILSLKAGRRVIEQLGDTDIRLAHVNAGVVYFQLDPRVEGYKRVVAGTCDFCERHTAEYGSHLVMALHPYCQCSLEPRVGRFSGVFRNKADTWTGVLVTKPSTTTEGRPTPVHPQPTIDPIPNLAGIATFAHPQGENQE